MIETWFLVLSLIFPRIALLIAYCVNQIPPNTIPFIGDVIMAVIIPRILILIYIFGVMGFCAWFWIHLVVLLLVCLSSSRIKSTSKNRR